MFPVIEKEVKKLLDAKIIVPLKYSSWVANLVLVRKNNGEIRFCVDFRNLNRSSLKDNYPLPKIEQILQKVVGHRGSLWLMVSQGTIRFICILMIRRKQLLPLLGNFHV